MELPDLPVAPTRIYIDLEGDPDRAFVYLLGIMIDDEGTERRYNFWANNESEEKLIFQQFMHLIAPYHQFIVFYYGSYEAAFLRRMRKRSTHKRLVDKVISNSFNILSVLYSHIYFPTYTNGLKDIGTYLGCTWSGQDVNGIKSIVWRRRWELNCDDALKRKLVTYNSEDVNALKRITQCIYHIVDIEESKSDTPHLVDGFDVARVENLRQQTADENMARQHLFCTILSTSTNVLISTIKETKFFSAPRKS